MLFIVGCSYLVYIDMINTQQAGVAANETIQARSAIYGVEVLPSTRAVALGL
jgi:hypothetical protein